MMMDILHEQLFQYMSQHEVYLDEYVERAKDNQADDHDDEPCDCRVPHQEDAAEPKRNVVR